MSIPLKSIHQIVKQFTLDFVNNPYLCYTEHGQHALFFSMLYNAIPDNKLFTTWNNQKVCIIQKEYPTAGKLGKPQRQHWDIALIKSPPTSINEGSLKSFDYLKLSAVVEFGMNEREEHLIDDIERLCHIDSNVEQGILIHLYRLSKPGAHFSGRDWSSNYRQIISKERVAEISLNKPVDIYYGMHDITNKYESGAWMIRKGKVHPLV